MAYRCLSLQCYENITFRINFYHLRGYDKYTKFFKHRQRCLQLSEGEDVSLQVTAAGGVQMRSKEHLPNSKNECTQTHQKIIYNWLFRRGGLGRVSHTLCETGTPWKISEMEPRVLLQKNKHGLSGGSSTPVAHAVTLREKPTAPEVQAGPAAFTSVSRMQRLSCWGEGGVFLNC